MRLIQSLTAHEQLPISKVVRLVDMVDGVPVTFKAAIVVLAECACLISSILLLLSGSCTFCSKTNSFAKLLLRGTSYTTENVHVHC